uniref:Reverse transcriptase domain-containing protein n=1 Tax=Cannabis sativa TaxID=3483 RepID=A0A803PNA5_CANSA
MKVSGKKTKRKGLNSSAEVKKMKTMDEILGVAPLEFSDDDEDDEQLKDTSQKLFQPLSPDSSLRLLQRQDEIAADFGFFLAANQECQSSISKGVTITPPIFRPDSMKFPTGAQLLYVASLVPIHLSRYWMVLLDEFGKARPVIMKAWDPNLNLKKEDIRTVPIWIQLEDLEVKYWGQKYLFKIVGKLGKPIMEDAITKERDKLTYPRVLIEDFPDLIYFDNEHGIKVSVAVKYEWKPIVCKHCQGMGHTSEDCRRKEGKKQEWVVKDKSKTKDLGAELQKNLGDFQPVTKDKRNHCFVTFVYGFNNEEGRLKLWQELMLYKTYVPWVVLGDFNDILERDERIGARVKYNPSSFKDCIVACNLEDVKFGGSFFTWNNKQKGEDRIYSKIDKVMANRSWMDSFPIAEALFLNEGLFNHTPALLTVYPSIPSGRKPFKGTKMYQIVAKLKALKPVLQEINRQGFHDIQIAEKKAKINLEESQKALQGDPLNIDLQQAEQAFRENYLCCLRKLTSLSSVRNPRILSIAASNGEKVEDPEQVTQAFLDYYQGLLGTKMQGRLQVKHTVIAEGPVLSESHAEFLLQEFSESEVKNAVFSIRGIKSPGPDGFGSYFFQDNWELIGKDICEAVSSFLQSGNLLKEINSTVITLIPKIKCPNKVSDFRPISCCNVLYKVATKLICSRLKHILPGLVSLNQGGFIKGRYIAHNIMICQDLIRSYAKKGAKPNCMFKIDLQKAYDTLDWDFLEEMLRELKFPSKFISLIMTCVKSPRYSLMFNGSLHGFFEAKRGLRQGDPMSPLLFVLGMEYLSRILIKVGKKEDFNFHERCGELRLNHLSFADDILLFCKGDFKSMYFLLQGLLLFSLTSGLNVNKEKSAIYCSGAGSISWEKICTPKKEGGLSIMNIASWNIAGMAKHVWAVANKKDNLWVKLVHCVYIKQQDWWEYNAPTTSIWYWRKMVEIKNKIKQVQQLQQFTAVKYQISNDVESLAELEVHSDSLHGLLKCIRKSKASKFCKGVKMAVVAALAYAIWRDRNDLLWNATSNHAADLVKQVKWAV